LKEFNHRGIDSGKGSWFGNSVKTWTDLELNELIECCLGGDLLLFWSVFICPQQHKAAGVKTKQSVKQRLLIIITLCAKLRSVL